MEGPMEGRGKAELRREIRQFREGISPKEKAAWDQAIFREFFCQLESFYPLEKEGGISCRTMIYLYLDIRNEAGTRLLLKELWRRGIRTAVPKTVGKDLEFYEITRQSEVPQTELNVGYMGILEPIPEVCRKAEERQAMVVVPGLVFDREGYRLGYGGGYYDRFFSREPDHPKWGLAYGFQIRDQIPREDWDQRMDKVITPEGTYGIPEFMPPIGGGLLKEHSKEIRRQR